MYTSVDRNSPVRTFFGNVSFIRNRILVSVFKKTAAKNKNPGILALF